MKKLLGRWKQSWTRFWPLRTNEVANARTRIACSKEAIRVRTEMRHELDDEREKLQRLLAHFGRMRSYLASNGQDALQFSAMYQLSPTMMHQMFVGLNGGNRVMLEMIAEYMSRNIRDCLFAIDSTGDWGSIKRWKPMPELVYPPEMVDEDTQFPHGGVG